MPIPEFNELEIGEAGEWIIAHLDLSQVNTYLFLAHVFTSTPVYLLSQPPHRPDTRPDHSCLSIATHEGIQHHLFQYLDKEVIEIMQYGKNIISKHKTSLSVEMYIARLTHAAKAKALSREELQLLSDVAHRFHLSEIPISTGLNREKTLEHIKAASHGTMWVVQEQNALRLYGNQEGEAFADDHLFSLKDDAFYDENEWRLDARIEQLKNKKSLRLKAVHFQTPHTRESATRQQLYLTKSSELKYQIESFLFVQDLKEEKKERILQECFYNQHRTIITNSHYLEGETSLSEAPFSYKLKRDNKSPLFIQACSPQSIDTQWDLSDFTEVTPYPLPVDAVLTALSAKAYQNIQSQLSIGSHRWPSIDAVKRKLGEDHFPSFILSKEDAESYLQYEKRAPEKIAWHHEGELWVSASKLYGVQHKKIAFNHFNDEGVVWKAEGSSITEVCIKTKFQAAFEEITRPLPASSLTEERQSLIWQYATMQATSPQQKEKEPEEVASKKSSAVRALRL